MVTSRDDPLEIRKLRDDLVIAQRNLTTANTKIARLEADHKDALAAQEAVLAESRKKYEILEAAQAADAQKHARELSTAQGNLNTANRTIARLEQDYSNLQALHNKLLEERGGEGTGGTEGGRQLERVMQKVELLDLKLDTFSQSLERLRDQPESPQAQTIRMQTFVDKIGSDLDLAQKTLAGRKSGFKLGRIALRVRNIVGEDGGLIESADINYEPDEDLSQQLQTQVPDVMQLTETAARRMLAAAGLQLRVSHGPASLAPGSAPGQAMRQVPGANATVARGTHVLVIFADTES